MTPQPNVTKVQDSILATIRSMNRCWTGGWHEEEFRQYIHPDAVAIAPSAPGRLQGRDAYVAGWKAFCDAAVIHEWRETDHTVQEYAGGKSAVVTYLFTITFVMGGTKQTMRGRDMFFLVKEGRKWLVAADQFSPEPLPAGCPA
ncbi:MAG: nuclear transport factor 2 family protein [Methanomicrobiales archaeon]|nr:nuclear transport factor 2 family protein [Methanomicrobiales archaeon]